jgi:hypothetical protein
MNRKNYVGIPVVLLATLMLAIVALVLWTIMLIPVMIFPRLLASVRPPAQFTEFVTRRVMQTAMKGMRK